MFLSLHKSINDKLNYFYDNNKIPNIIFHGINGTGKKTIVFNFINKIYEHNKQKIKSNVMFVNCSQGKGIKFIREDLKFFAKTNLQQSNENNDIKFKSIVLFNADSLTNDAQSALRRCIELFSHNTRFFIVVENKEKLLKPILSRFCEIYVPENIENEKITNLHEQKLKNDFDFDKLFPNNLDEMRTVLDIPQNIKNHVACSEEIYEKGFTAHDFLEFIFKKENFDEDKKTNILFFFNKIRTEYRNEKLLLLQMMEFIFLR